MITQKLLVPGGIAIPVDKIKFTVNMNYTASATRRLYLNNFTEPKDAVVYWGDNTSTVIGSDTTSANHTYASSGTYSVCIEGSLGGFWNTSAVQSGGIKITSVDEIESKSLTTLIYTFRGCTNLTVAPTKIIAPNLTNYSHAFYSCTKLTNAPVLIAPKVIGYSWTFYGTKLTSTPVMNYPKVTHCNGTFASCTSLETISNMSLPAASTCYSMFYNCKSITSPYPNLWVTNGGAVHSSCFTSAHKTCYSYFGGSANCSAFRQSSYYAIYGKNNCPNYGGISSEYVEDSYYTRNGNSAVGCSYKVDGYVQQGTKRTGVNPLCTYGYTVSTYNGKPCIDIGTSIGNDPYDYGCVANWTNVEHCRNLYSLTYQCSYYQSYCQNASCGAYDRKCARDNGLCRGTSCPFAALNQASVDAATSAGWA